MMLERFNLKTVYIKCINIFPMSNYTSSLNQFFLAYTHQIHKRFYHGKEDIRKESRKGHNLTEYNGRVTTDPAGSLDPSDRFFFL